MTSSPDPLGSHAHSVALTHDAIDPPTQGRAPAPSPSTIRASLTGLVTACLAPALLVSGYLVHDPYAQQRARIERDTLLQARNLVTALDRELSGVILGLRMLSTSPGLNADDLRGFHERARSALAFQIVDNYVVTDRAGRQRMNTLRDPGEPLPDTGVPPELQRVFETGKPAVSGLFLAAGSDRPSIGIGVPVFRQMEVIYGLSAGLSPERIAEVLRRLAIPGHWVAAVLDGTGTIVARTRDPEKFIGKKATPDVMALLNAGPTEAIITSRTLEDVPTHAGLTRSSVSDWSVIVAAPRSAVEAALYRSIAWLIAGAAAAFGLGLWIAAWLGARISGSIRALVGPALSLGSGSPAEHLPPSRLKETEAVSRAIVQAGRMLNEARRQARHDPLAGLPNRLLFDETGKQPSFRGTSSWHGPGHPDRRSGRVQGRE